MAAQFDSAPAETYVPANQVLMYTLSDSGGAVSASHRFIVVVFENGIDVGKWTVPTIYEEERLQKIFDKINELEERVKTLENKTK